MAEKSIVVCDEWRNETTGCQLPRGHSGLHTHSLPNGVSLSWPSEIDLCLTCKGKSDPYCGAHGIGASNARQSEFYRRWNERNGE